MELMFVVLGFIDACSCLLACIRSPESKRPPGIRRLLSAEILAFGTVTFRTSSGIAAQGTVASPGPVAGLGVTRAAPDADHTLTRLLGAVNLASGIAQAVLSEERIAAANLRPQVRRNPALRNWEIMLGRSSVVKITEAEHAIEIASAVLEDLFPQVIDCRARIENRTLDWPTGTEATEFYCRRQTITRHARENI